MKDLTEIRKEIDKIDDRIVADYIRRIELCAEVACEKMKTGKAVADLEREQKILYRITENLPEKYYSIIKELYGTIFATSFTTWARVVECAL